MLGLLAYFGVIPHVGARRSPNLQRPFFKAFFRYVRQLQLPCKVLVEDDAQVFCTCGGWLSPCVEAGVAGRGLLLLWCASPISASLLYSRGELWVVDQSITLFCLVIMLTRGVVRFVECVRRCYEQSIVHIRDSRFVRCIWDV